MQEHINGYLILKCLNCNCTKIVCLQNQAKKSASPPPPAPVVLAVTQSVLSTLPPPHVSTNQSRTHTTQNSQNQDQTWSQEQTKTWTQEQRQVQLPSQPLPTCSPKCYEKPQKETSQKTVSSKEEASQERQEKAQWFTTELWSPYIFIFLIDAMVGSCAFGDRVEMYVDKSECSRVVACNGISWGNISLTNIHRRRDLRCSLTCVLYMISYQPQRGCGHI